MDWFHGGLQFQTEHHLFPKMPRRAAGPYVQKFAAKHGLPYHMETFYSANVRMLPHLRQHGVNFGELLADSVSG